LGPRIRGATTGFEADAEGSGAGGSTGGFGIGRTAASGGAAGLPGRVLAARAGAFVSVGASIVAAGGTDGGEDFVFTSRGLSGSAAAGAAGAGFVFVVARARAGVAACTDASAAVAVVRRRRVVAAGVMPGAGVVAGVDGDVSLGSVASSGVAGGLRRAMS
jgi:hypothetical protein